MADVEKRLNEPEPIIIDDEPSPVEPVSQPTLSIPLTPNDDKNANEFGESNIYY